MSVASVVLAAGGSSRMGQPKQLLNFDGESLLRRAVRTALDAGCDPVVVVLGASADLLSDELSGLTATVVVNGHWDQGPGTSLRRGMAAVGDAEAVVFLACDQPFVDFKHVKRLVRAWRDSSLPMAASAYADTIGVPALFAASCFADLRRLPTDSGAKKLLLAQRDHVAAVPFPSGALDLDTPSDVALASNEGERIDAMAEADHGR